MLSLALQEYSFTIGLLIAFVGTILFAVLGRRHIADALKHSGVKPWHLLAGLLLVLVFLSAEVAIVQPTQQLYFDDDIYQGMAVDLLHQGQAWFCDYGTPTNCIIGEILHEPIGMPFNLAIGFAVFGVSIGTAYNTALVISCFGVLLTFLVAFLLSKRFSVAFFSGLLMGLSPLLLVWARTSTSDIASFTYSILAVFFLLVFIKRKNVLTFGMLAFSVSLSSYMKVNALGMLPVLVLMYLFLDGKSLKETLSRNAKLIKRTFLQNTGFLVVLLLFVISISPEMFYSYNQLLYGTYDYVGVTIQNSCNMQQSMMVTGKFNFANFNYNICANVLFWFNQYTGQNIMQPILFTALAILGAGLMLIDKRRRELASVGVWFLVFFFIYAFFYAGSVLYGVDWRFVLSMIAQVSILGGFGAGMLVDYAASIKANLKSHLPEILAGAALVVLITASFAQFIPQLAIKPIDTIQAGDARFYEGFVYNESSAIPTNCIVFTYDPGLFNINNRSAAQMSFVYQSSTFMNITNSYSCLVADWGYWCYTPDNLCTGLTYNFTLTPIVNSTFSQDNKTYGFYYIKAKNSTNSTV